MSNAVSPKPAPVKRALTCAVSAAQAAGQIMRANLRAVKKIAGATQHDIKLELDVRCQKIIERMLRRAFPDFPILGEEGGVGDTSADTRWVVDPIDGTVNFTYGIPHACVSIALQVRETSSPLINKSPKAKIQSPTANGQRPASQAPSAASGFQTVVGVVYDPFCDELWTAVRGGPARLNGRAIRASSKTRLDEAIVSIGFAKDLGTLQQMLPTMNELVHRVRKIRIMGSAALSLVYVATGRMDAFIEYGLRLWDFAAGGLIIECAKGEFWNKPVLDGTHYRILASNGRLQRQLQPYT